MKAAYVEKLGPPEALHVGEFPDPKLLPGQVLIQAAYATVNPIDCYLRSGLVPMTLPMPFIPGCDVAGSIVALSDGVSGWKVGQQVWATNQGLLGRQGTLAELSAVDADRVYPVPSSVSLRDAAACGLVGATAWLGLANSGKLRSGDSVFVRGGSGGVGSMVIQMAVAMGARVAASAGSEENAAKCRAMGAQLAVVYRDPQWRESVKQFAPHGVDLFWDCTREPDFDLSVELMAENGRMILMAGREARPAFPVGPFYVKQLSLHGVVVFKAANGLMRQAAEWINAALADGRLSSHIACELPLQDSANAHRLQEEHTLDGRGSLNGKILIRVRD